MIRKPKIHPKWNDINLVGINFRERWNVVEYATKEEICRYIANHEHIKKVKRDMSFNSTSWWERKQAVVDETTQNIYLRKLWRKRHSESFEQDVLYRVERNIRRWNLKLGPKMGDGLAVSYHFDRRSRLILNKNDILVLTKTDEMGNLYFSKVDEIDAPNPYVFNRENAQLGWIREIES